MLFSETRIGDVLIKNRFVRSATWEGRADEDGSVTEELIRFYKELSKNEIGLIITGHAYVRKEGKATPKQVGIYDIRLLSGLKRLVKEVHRYDTRIFIQLSHSGIFGRKDISGTEPLDLNKLNKKEIEDLVHAFYISAMISNDAGFDGIQLHAAHGYLISQFFSPLFNKRQDEYGRGIRNRARFAEQIISCIKKELSYYTILVKMNCQDFAKTALTLDESIEIAKILIDAGADGIEISGGLLISRKKGPCRTEKGPYFLKEALVFKETLKMPIILVGGIRAYSDAEDILNKGIDLISMSRPFICEPDLVKRWKMGDKRDSLCVSDNLCLKAVKTKTPVTCIRRDMDEAKTHI